MKARDTQDPEIKGFIMPPEWLRPMPEAKLKDVCFEAMMQTVLHFQDFEKGAKQGMNAVGNLLRHHGYEFETVGEISIFLGIPIAKNKLH